MKQPSQHITHINHSFWPGWVCCMVLMLLFGTASAQTNVTNKGTMIYIPEGATMFISGDYEDEGVLTGRGIRLGGELELHGDFINNNTNPEEAIFDGNFIAGHLIFAGTGTQIISGGSTAFRKLRVDKPGGELRFNQTTLIKDGLELIDGNVVLNQDVTIAEENTSLTDASPTLMSHVNAAVVSGPGSILASRPALNNGDAHVDNLDVVGTGIGFVTDGGSMNELEIARNHQELTSFGNGISIFRNYSISVVSDIGLESIRISYLNNEFRSSGTLVEADLAIYLSDDNGTSWQRLGGTVVAASNYIEVDLSGDPLTLVGSQNYKLGLGHNSCDAGNKPIVQYSATSNNPLRADIAALSAPLDICKEGEISQVTVSNSNATAGALTYAYWTIPNGADVEAMMADLTVDNDDVAAVSTQVRSANGCEGSGQFHIESHALPLNTFTSTPTTAECQNEQILFTHANEDKDGLTLNNAVYTWNFNSPENGMGSSPDNAAQQIGPERRFIYDDYGVQTVRVNVVSEFQCASEPELTFTVNPVPDFDFSIADVCRDDMAEFNVSIADAIPQTSGDFHSIRMYDWIFGDGNDLHFEDTPGSVESSFDHTYTDVADELETMDVTLTMTFKATGCDTDITKQLLVMPKPDAAFTPRFEGGAVTEICVGEIIDFENETSFSDATTNVLYTWNFGDATGSTEESPEKQYFAKGDYTASLYAESETYGCNDQVTWDIEVHPEPQGGFTVIEKDICSAETAQLVNETTILDPLPNLQYEWDFGDGTTSNSTDINIYHDYAEAGKYTISLERTSQHGCANTVTRTIDIHPEPEADFKIDDACMGDETLFTSTSTISSDVMETLTWTFHDASEQDGNTASYIYDEAVDRAVTLEVVSDYGCMDQITKNASPDQRPVFTLDPTVECQSTHEIIPNIAIPADVPAGSTYEWHAMSDMSLISTNPTATVSESGNYQLIVTGPTALACEGVNTVTVYLFDDVDLGPDVTFCEAGELEAAMDGIGFLTDSQVTYIWELDGNPTGADESTLTANAAGTYTVEVDINIPGFGQCSVDDVTEVTIDPELVLSVDDGAACEGESVTLDAGIAGATYTWTQLSTGFTVGSDQEVDLTEEGFYQVDVQRGNCHADAQAEVTIYDQPVVSFDYADQGVCENVSVDFTNLSYPQELGDAIVGYTWDFGDGSPVSNLENPSKSYAAAGFYDITLTVQTSNGCNYDLTQQIEIFDFPDVDFAVNDVCVGESLDLSGPAGAGYSYFWDFGNGHTSTLQNPGTVFTLADTYSVSLTVTNLNGCQTSQSHDVTVNDLPTLDLGGSVATCASSITLDALNAGSTYSWRDNLDVEVSTNQQYEITTDGDYSVIVTNASGCETEENFTVTLSAPIVPDLGADREVCGSIELDAGFFDDASYAWSTGANTRYITVTTSGTYEVDVLDINGCAGSSSVTITVRETPIVDLGGDQTICESSTVILDAANAGSSFDWSDGSDQQSLEVTTTGTYHVEVTNGFGCSAEDEVLITVNAEPAVSFTFDEKCTSEQVDFTNLTTISSGELMSYSWDFGDGSNSTQTSPSKAYSANGDYDVTLEVTGINGCTESLTQTIDIHPNPTANFILNPVCEAEEFTITNTSSVSDASELTYHWSAGDGRTFTDEEPMYSYAENGDFLVSLTATSSHGCETSRSKWVSVGVVPELDFGGTITRCDASYTLDAENVGSTYRWSDNSTNQTLMVTETNTYSVEVTSADGCSMTEIVNVEFMGSDVAPDLGDDQEVCGEALLDPTIRDVAFYWSTGETTETITVQESGNYEVTTVSNDLCIVADDIDVIVNPIPEIDLGNSQEACEGELLTLDAESPLDVDYLWSTGETSSAIEVSLAGMYSVELITDLGCSFIEEVDVIFNALPVLDFSDVMEDCDEIFLDAGNFGSIFNWSTGEETQFITTDESGNYTVEVTNDSECTNSQTFEVVVHETPVFDLGPDQQICYGETLVLSSGLADMEYWWSNQSTASQLEVGSTGSFTHEVTSGAGCVGVDEIYIEMAEPFTVDLGEDRINCGSQDRLLDAGVEGFNYLWESDSGFVATEQVVEGNTAGKYWVTVTNDIGCTQSDTIYIAPTDKQLFASFLSSSLGDRGDTIQFAQLSEPQPETFLWDFGDGQFSNLENPQHRYLREGEFDVTLTVSNEICSDTMTKTLTIRYARTDDEEEGEVAKFLEIVEMKVFPNPVRDRFSFEVELSKDADTYLFIYDVTGVLMQSRIITGSQQQAQFDFSTLADGVYFLHASVGKKSEVIRIIKK